MSDSHGQDAKFYDAWEHFNYHQKSYQHQFQISVRLGDRLVYVIIVKFDDEVETYTILRSAYEAQNVLLFAFQVATTKFLILLFSKQQTWHKVINYKHTKENCCHKHVVEPFKEHSLGTSSFNCPVRNTNSFGLHSHLKK